LIRRAKKKLGLLLNIKKKRKGGKSGSGQKITRDTTESRGVEGEGVSTG